MPSIADLLKQQPDLAPYAADPEFDALTSAIEGRFPDFEEDLAPGSNPANLPVALMTVASVNGREPPSYEALAFRILTERFRIKFDKPPEAEALERAAARWHEVPQASLSTLSPPSSHFEALRGTHLVAVHKTSYTDAFSVYLGLPGARFTGLGTLPAEDRGARLAALRFIVANGDVWERHYDWQRLLRDRGITEQQIEAIKNLVKRIRAMGAEEIDTNPKVVEEIVDQFFADIVARSHAPSEPKVSDEILRFLVAEQRHPEIRQAAQARLRKRAVGLYQDHPHAADLLYLSTYDITRYPTTTVSAAERMKYVIIPIKGEMGTRAVREALAAGKIPVVVYSEQDDSNSLPKRLAEEGGGFAIPAPGNSGAVYANASLIIQRVKETFQGRFKAEASAELTRAALYPGYGAFAENDGAIAEFRRAGIVFIGPMEDVVIEGGDKRNFRTIAGRQAPDHITPGITIVSDDPEVIQARVAEGYRDGKFLLPGRLKAANGGGGGGQVVVESLDVLPKAIEQVRAEIQSKRWTPGVMFEQNIPDTVHVEVPLARDRYGTTICFFQRDCTEQRSSQKIQEEAPPAILRKYPGLGGVMMDLAARIANDLGYVGAGTVELMFKDGHFYFLEMNTRLQVETPVTEETIEILRADGTREPLNLVQLQYAIAEGKPIDFTQEEVVLNGFVAREFRINAETWDSAAINNRDKKPGTFLPPNYVIFSEMTVPLSVAEIGKIIKTLKARGVQGIAELKVRWDCGFEAGDRLINQDPNFAKLIVCVKPEKGFEEQAYELLRQASLEVLHRVRIRGEQQSLKGVIGEVDTNISAHVRILEAPVSKRHARGVIKGRHVDWVTRMLREGTNLDASPYPALMRQSYEGMEVPVVYAIHRDDPNLVDVGAPEVFLRPENYGGLLARHLEAMRWRREGLTLEKFFDVGALRLGVGGHRVGVAMDPQGNVLNAVLYNRQDLPISMLVSLEVMGVSHLLRINLTYNTTIHGTVTDLTTRKKAPITMARDATGGYPPFRFTLPGPKGAGPKGAGLPEMTLAVDIDNEHKEVTLRNAQGDYVIRVRSHMARAAVGHYVELLRTLADKTLPDAARQDYRGQLQQTFVDMAIVAGQNTETRSRFVSQLAHSPYSLGTEIALMTLYNNPDNPDLQRQVRHLAYEVLFYRYYDTRFHHVDSYEMVSDGDSPVIYGTFHDDPAMWVVRRVEEIRHVVWLKVPETDNLSETVGEALDQALALLRERGGEKIGEDDVIEIITPQTGDDTAFARLLEQVVNERMTGVSLRRVTFDVYSRVGDPSYQPGDGFYTFRPTKAGTYEEASPRHIHPMGAEQMEQWRWIKFNRRPVTSSHRGVQVTEVIAQDNPADQRYVLGALLRHELEQVRLQGQLLSRYILALAHGEADAEDILSSERDETTTVPMDLPQRLQNLFRWALYQERILTDLTKLNDPIDVLFAKHLIDDETIELVCTALDGIVYTIPELESAFAREIVDLRKLRKAEGTNQTHFNNRVQIFVQEPTHFDPRGMAFLAYHFREAFSGLDIEKASVHFPEPNGGEAVSNQIFTWRPDPHGINSVPPAVPQVPASNKLVDTKTTYETAEALLNRSGAYTPRQQAELFFDAGGPLREIVVENLGQVNERVVEADYDPRRRDVRIRGIIGLVGGRRTLLVTPDLINIGKYVYFDKDDGELTARYIEYANNEREGDDIVGMPLLNVEEVNFGANLKTGVKSLVQYGHKFRPIYKTARGDPRHAYRRANPNVSVVLAKVAGGGGYAPKGSHITLGIRGVSVIVLTGAKASAAEAGGVPVYRKGKIEVGGVQAKFDEDRVGSTEGPGRRRIFTAVVTTPKIEQLMGEGKISVAKVAGKLTPDDLLEAKRIAFEEARYFTLLEGNRVDSLLPSDFSAAGELERMSVALATYVQDQFFNLKRGDIDGLRALEKEKRAGTGGAVPSFVPVLKDLAVKDAAGRPILRFWGDGSEDLSLGDNLRCGFVALPVEQIDGTIKVEVVGFKVNPARSKTGGAITIEAAKKDAAFTRIISNLGLAMVRFSGSDGFFSTEAQELEGIEDDGAKALAEVTDSDEHHPQAVTYTLEVKKNQGGARIFSAGEELSDKGNFVTDALDLDTIRLAAIGPAATAMVTATTPFTNRVKTEGEKKIPGETDEARVARIDAALLDEHAKQTVKAIPAGTVAQAVKDGGIRGAVNPLYVRQAISSGVLQARRQRLLYEETGAHLRRWGIDYVQARTPNGRFDLKGQFRINGREEVYDAEGMRDYVARLQRLENLANPAGTRMVTTRDGRALIDGVEYATPEDYIRAVGVQTLLGPAGAESNGPDPMIEMRHRLAARNETGGRRGGHGNPRIHQGPEHHGHRPRGSVLDRHDSVLNGGMFFAGAPMIAENSAMLAMMGV